MIAPTAEHVIRAAAEAQRAYWQLIQDAGENPRFRLALMDRRVQVDAELRGECCPRLTPPVDMALSVVQNVERRLEAMRPAVHLDIVRERATKRLAGCGLVQLALSYRATMRRRLKQLIKGSGLETREFAAAIGVAPTTVQRWLHGARIPHERQIWLQRIESISVDRKGRVQFTMGPTY